MTWDDFNKTETAKPYYKELYDFVQKEYKNHVCYPPENKILNALQTTPYDDVKVVILGQDPYHGPNQAMGLSFSVGQNVTVPRSLQNIYKELKNDMGCFIPDNGDLTEWAKQGVLLLNSVLTVREHAPGSHKDKGWETYTDNIISTLNEKTTPVVFLLWGSYAKSKKYLITNPEHLILEAAHPSPFSAGNGFFGCKHFSKCNAFLRNNNLPEINWQISNK